MPRIGIEYDDLLNKENPKRGYTSNLAELFNVEESKRKPLTFSESVDKLKKHTEGIIEEINAKRGAIEDFVIGKTFARQRDGKDFDPSKFQTWRLADGVNGRWRKTYEVDGFDGMVVLCAVTKELLPDVKPKRNRKNEIFDQQTYSIALEQQLIHYFLFQKNDNRLANQSLNPGKLGGKAFAYVVYLAFKLDREE